MDCSVVAFKAVVLSKDFSNNKDRQGKKVFRLVRE